MFGLACSKFGLKISGTCSRRSKFDPPKFEEFEVRLFDVRSKTIKLSSITFTFLALTSKCWNFELKYSINYLGLHHVDSVDLVDVVELVHRS